MVPNFDEAQMREFAREDPDYDIEYERKLLRDRYGYCELTEENDQLFWYMHDVEVLGQELADRLHSDVEIPESESYSVSVRLRRIAVYLNKLKYAKPKREDGGRH